jgi:hypothetical protein
MQRHHKEISRERNRSAEKGASSRAGEAPIRSWGGSTFRNVEAGRKLSESSRASHVRRQISSALRVTGKGIGPQVENGSNRQQSASSKNGIVDRVFNSHIQSQPTAVNRAAATVNRRVVGSSPT